MSTEVHVPAGPPAADQIRARYETLLEVSESIVACRRLEDLLRHLREPLHKLVAFDAMTLTLFDPEERTMRLHVIEADFPQTLPPSGTSLPVDATPAADALATLEPFYVPDTQLETRYPRLFDILRAHGVRSACMLPLYTANRKLGGLNFASRKKDAYSESDRKFMCDIARQVAVAVENALNHEAASAYEQRLAHERDRMRLLLEVNNAAVRHLELRELFSTLVTYLRRVLFADVVSITLYDAETDSLKLAMLDFPGQAPLREGDSLPMEPASPQAIVFATRTARVFQRSDLESLSPRIARLLQQAGVQCGCVLPLISGERALGTLNIGSRTANAFASEDIDMLTQVAGQVAIAIDNALAYKRIAELNAKLAEEKLYLEDEIRTQYQFEEIIGRSAALRAVLQKVETVAPSDSTVLLLGETGTGKEVIARAIHNLSSRRQSTFVKVNCAAIPTGLLESELFGHEKGAFTGAIARRIGRFELANGGTLFLDEVGEIPLELQSKLLRVLQEREFERLGSARTLHVDVRVIAATNRNLLDMVNRRAFRDDLYYRLNVFPITIPPLRDRREDIPLLVRYFTQQSARSMKKEMTSIPTETMDALVRYDWPGNVRELQNMIERAVIISPGPVLHVPLNELQPSRAPETGSPRTLEQAERQHILQALEATNWVIGGPNGAAARLGMKRSTLQFRMQKLGIVRSH